MPSANRDPGFYQRLSALALPIILQNLISTSLGFADTFMVGLLSSDALSAVAAANALLFLLQTAIFWPDQRSFRAGQSILGPPRI